MLCLEYRLSWVRVPPEAAPFFLGKVTTFGVLCCFALFVCLTLLASFFLLSHLSFKTCTCTCTSGIRTGCFADPLKRYTYMHLHLLLHKAVHVAYAH